MFEVQNKVIHPDFIEFTPKNDLDWDMSQLFGDFDNINWEDFLENYHDFVFRYLGHETSYPDMMIWYDKEFYNLEAYVKLFNTFVFYPTSYYSIFEYENYEALALSYHGGEIDIKLHKYMDWSSLGEELSKNMGVIEIDGRLYFR